MAGGLWTNSSGDGLWSTAGNWASGVPTDNDKAIFDPSQGGSNTPVTGGLGQSGIDLDLLYVHESYTANIGSSGTPLEIAADEVRFYGSGRLFYSCTDGAGTDVTDRFFIRCPRTDSAAQVEINSKTGDDGEVDFIHVVRGNVQLKSTLIGVDLLEIGYVNNPAGDVIIGCDVGTVTLAMVRQYGGHMVNECTITALHQAGGTMIHNTNAITSHYGSGGRLVYNSSSTLGSAIIGGSHVLDMRQTARTRTVTTLVASGQSEYHHDRSLTTITNEFDYRERTLARGN